MLVQTGHFQLAYAVCQQLGGTPSDPDDGERWLEGRQRNNLWSANAHPDTFADFVRLRAPWSTLAETCQRLKSTLEGRVTPVQPGSRPLDPTRRGHRARLHPPRR